MCYIYMPYPFNFIIIYGDLFLTCDFTRSDDSKSNLKFKKYFAWNSLILHIYKIK